MGWKDLKSSKDITYVSMDLMMYKDGYTLAKKLERKIMKFQYFDSKIEEDVLKDKAGADDYLNKPLTLKFCL
jgi:DNA-binding response OmpR family regulator